MKTADSLTDIIARIAAVPSFTSYEERLHALVCQEAATIPNCKLRKVEEHNLVLEVPGDEKRAPIALSAHLDKINHYHPEKPPKSIAVKLVKGDGKARLHGLLDDAVGVGLCLHLLKISESRRFPPLQVLLSECEEGAGFRHGHPMRNDGEGLESGIGARRLAHDLKKQPRMPAAVIVLDVTPLFDGQPGIALYKEHWEINGLTPSKELVQKTEKIAATLKNIHPAIREANNTNDYLVYGKELCDNEIPCLALEPSINGYHSLREEVYISDIKKTADILTRFLEDGAQAQK